MLGHMCLADFEKKTFFRYPAILLHYMNNQANIFGMYVQRDTSSRIFPTYVSSLTFMPYTLMDFKFSSLSFLVNGIITILVRLMFPNSLAIIALGIDYPS